MRTVKPTENPIATQKGAKVAEMQQKRPARNAQEALKPAGQGKGIAGKGQKLTGKQDHFARCVAEGKSQADAYRAAYEAGKMTAEAIQCEASKLMSNPTVTQRVEFYRLQIGSKVAEAITYGYNEAMSELDEAIAFARECKQPGAAVAALNLKQKISGLHVEERKNNRTPIEGLDYEQTKAALQALQALKKAGGVPSVA